MTQQQQKATNLVDDLKQNGYASEAHLKY